MKYAVLQGLPFRSSDKIDFQGPYFLLKLRYLMLPIIQTTIRDGNEQEYRTGMGHIYYDSRRSGSNCFRSLSI